MTDAERAAALEAIASDVRSCTRCRLHEGRTTAVPGEGSASSDVVFVGEGPGFNEDREGRPFVGRAGGFLGELLGSIGWRRDEVFITNIVKCRPPENRDPEPDEIAACAPFLRRQLAVLDPALVVTLGRHSMGRFMPGTTISRAHGTTAPIDPAEGPRGALAFAMYHPAAALRTPAIATQSLTDMAAVPAALEWARATRAGGSAELSLEARSAVAPDARRASATPDPEPVAASGAPATPVTPALTATPTESAPAGSSDQLTLFR